MSASNVGWRRSLSGELG